MPVVPAPVYRLERTAPAPAEAPALDAAQQRVVDHPGGPLLVLAGPGTGKTTTLVEAVVDRVERRGTEPDRLLVLTFSRKAADELRERITARLGRTVREPSAYTFHAWCYALVRAWPDEPGQAAPRLLSGAERDVRVRELLRGHVAGEGRAAWPAELRPALDLRGFTREVCDLIDRARERGLDGAALRELGEREGKPAWVAGGRFLDEYDEVLRLRGECDYAGLVGRALDLLDRPEVLDDVRARYAAVFVDEYQDTDPSQEALLRRVAGGGRDLVVVGDPDQSIYAFRGAEVSCILDFPERFRTASGQPAPAVALEASRRMSEPMLAPSRALAQRIPLPGLARSHRDLRGLGPAPDAEPQIRLFATVAEEVTAIADLLRRAHLEDGMAWEQMAVLVRSGVRSIPVLRRAFGSAGVPVAVAADEVPIAQDPTIQPLLTALRLAEAGRPADGDADSRASWLDPVLAEVLLLSPLGRGAPRRLRALGRALRSRQRAEGHAFPQPSAILLRDALLDPRLVIDLPPHLTEPVERMGRLVSAAAEALADGTPEDALWALWEGSGWGRRLEAEAARGGLVGQRADRDLDAALALFQAAARLEERRPRAGAGALLEELEAQVIPAAPVEERAAAGGSVRLLTAHRSKGLEWDLVVVAGLQEGVWPDLRRRGSLLEADAVDRDGLRQTPSAAQLLAEERRLLYVALTRAKARLVITGVSSFDEAGDRPSRFLDELGLAVPEAAQLAGTELLTTSSLVARLRRALVDEHSSAAVKLAAARRLAVLAPDVPSADPSTWWGQRELTEGPVPLRPVEEPIALSGSGVQGHDTCPLRWFLEREVGAASVSSTAQGFGLVIHALAKLLSDGVVEPDADALVARLDEVWPSLGYDARWHADAERVAAIDAIRRLLAWHTSRPTRLAGAEVEFRVQVGDVVIRGSADRVEVDEAGTVQVIDFKTGKSAPSAKELAAHPQLGVYQVAAREGAFDDVTGGRLPVGGARLVHLRQERKGGLPHEQVQASIGDEDWADQLIDRVATSIRAEEFTARPNSYCEKCAMKLACPAVDAGKQVIQ
jgi:superfamily I DNA/RNA helicase/RecB family exonuclease